MGHAIFTGARADADPGVQQALKDVGDSIATYSIPHEQDNVFTASLRCCCKYMCCTSNIPMEHPRDRDPYSHIFVPLDPSPAAGMAAWKLYGVYPSTGTVLSEVQSLRALESALTSPIKDGGAGLNLDTEGYTQRWLQQAFVLPNAKAREELADRWIVCCQLPWSQPFNRIKSYAGEKIAMAFIVTGYLTQSLLVPSIIGAALMIHQVLEEEPSVVWAPVFSVFIALWAVLTFKGLKRSQAVEA